MLKGWKKIMSQREFTFTVYKEQGMLRIWKEITMEMT